MGSIESKEDRFCLYRLNENVWMRLSPAPSFQLTNPSFYDVNFLVILAITIVVLCQS